MKDDYMMVDYLLDDDGEHFAISLCYYCNKTCMGGICTDCFAMHEDVENGPADERPVSGVVRKTWAVIRSRNSAGPWTYHNHYDSFVTAKQRCSYLMGRGYMAAAVCQQLLPGYIKPVIICTHGEGFAELTPEEEPISCERISDWPQTKPDQVG